ncbi:STAS domain-containing protein [Mycobacterium celatum]|uniref:STAS domain-containing protein n=1 Tax=Mycobacterium celatum TaxID=28045 RepID=UPI00278BF1C6|nr:STAS domain-containing protein [Mycobacterium celatum]
MARLDQQPVRRSVYPNLAGSVVVIAVPRRRSLPDHRRGKEPATTLLDVHREELDDVVLLQLRGEVDLSNVEVLELALDQICSGIARRVIIDATAITFLSMAAVAALVQAQANGLDLVLVAVQRAVLRPLEATGLAQRLKIFASLDAALAIAT